MQFCEAKLPRAGRAAWRSPIDSKYDNGNVRAAWRSPIESGVATPMTRAAWRSPEPLVNVINVSEQISGIVFHFEFLQKSLILISKRPLCVMSLLVLNIPGNP